MRLDSEALALMIRAYGQRPHPTFGTGAMHHVEGNHVAIGVPPDHGPVTGVFQGVAPNQVVELGHSNSH